MAYAAVMSLKHNIKHLIGIDIDIDDPIPTVINPQITKDAYAIMCSLGDILQILDNKRDQSFDVVAIKALDAEIRKAAWKLEDVLESYALHQMQMKMKMPLVVEQEIQSFINTSEKFVRDFSRLIENNLETEEEEEEEEEEGDVWAIGGSKLRTVELFKDGFEGIMEWFLKYESAFPVTVTLGGMAGIGKTHFAREICQHPLVIEHFEFTAWVRVGQKCTSLKKILVEIIAQIQIDRKPRDTYVDEDEETLSDLLAKSLDGRGECLVVLDDAWSKVVCCDIIHTLFNSGVSKFLLTTRIQDIYVPFHGGNLDYQMPFWDNEKSWNLLWQSVFPDRSSFPPQLEKAGRKIAENCEGLPLLILVVANILSRADKTEEFWNKFMLKASDAWPSKTTCYLASKRVLDAVAIRLYEFPEEVVKLLLLRYLSLNHNGKLPSSISNLQKLQFLIVSQHHNIKLLRDHFHSTFLPDDIWEMKQLKYLRIMEHTLPNPRNDDAELPNLETLHVSFHSCTKAVMRGVPNLDKLAIKIDLEPESSGVEALGCLEHIGTLKNLRRLKCKVVNPRRLIRFEVVKQSHQLSNFLPTHDLRKLSLNGLGCSWEFMSAIGTLPDLRVLKLRCCAFEGPKWEMEVTGEFRGLRHMLLEDMDVVEWTINKQDCFPVLYQLAIQYCFKLKEIPLAFGDRQYMSKMELIDCNPSLVASATKIQLQNPSITLVINSSFL